MRLVRRYQQGDKAALGELLARYQERLRRIVRVRLSSRLRARLDSMDIVQEVNLVAAQKLDRFELRSQASILQWLSAIVLNKIRDADDFLTAGKRDARREAAADSALVNLAPDAPRPEELAWRAELREILDEGLTRLPESYREVILLRDYSAADWGEVAERLERPSERAAQELHRRAWIRLRTLVAPRLGGLA